MKNKVTNEWTLSASQVINYAGSNTYTYFNDEQKGRVSFASNNRTGDASLEISFLQPSDAGQYTCKVKNAGQYEWTHITLKVLGKALMKLFQDKHLVYLLSIMLFWLTIKSRNLIFFSYSQKNLPNPNAGKKER